MPETYDFAVDFMDMTDDRRLWVRPADARPGLDLIVGRHVVVGDEDADPRVARILMVDADGNLELEVLPGVVGFLSRCCHGDGNLRAHTAADEAPASDP